MVKSSKQQHLIMNPYSCRSGRYMTDEAVKAGWKGDRSTINTHYVPRDDLSPRGRVERVMHFTNVDCNVFTLRTVVYCVMLFIDGTMQVIKHLVGECPHCLYLEKHKPWSVKKIQFKRDRAKNK